MLTLLLAQILLHTPTLATILCIVAIVLLLFMSGFASGAEIAFFSLTPSDISTIESSKSARDAKVKQLREETERTLATILVTNNLVNVTIIMLSNYTIGQLVDFGDALWLQFLCVTVLLTFLLLLFGEIMPKVFASQGPLTFCRRAADGVLFCRRLFYPVASIILKSGIIADKMSPKAEVNLSVDQLGQALNLTDKQDIADEQQILEGIVRFGDETAKEIMTSRQDVVALDFSTPFDSVLKSIIDNHYSRIPVYQGSLDNIRGILYIKDLLPHLKKHHVFRWQSLIRPPYFVPETKMIPDLLNDFRENKVHIAIVVDEFGGTSGIVTLEDILEEIVGEINDEFDDDTKTYTKLADSLFVFEGKTLLSDFCRILNLPNDKFEDVEGEADSLAGLLLEIKGDFPTLHEKLSYQNFTFEILEMDGHRISKVKVHVQNPDKA